MTPSRGRSRPHSGPIRRGGRWFHVSLGLLMLLTMVGLPGIAACGGSAAKRGGSEATKPASSLGSDAILRVGDSVQVGLYRLTVDATSSSSGRAFGLASMPRPPKGKQWLVVGVTIENGSKEATDLEEFLFSLSEPKGPNKPAQVMIATDKSQGLSSAGVLEPGGKLSMSLAFRVSKTEKTPLLIFRLANRPGGAQYLLR